MTSRLPSTVFDPTHAREIEKILQGARGLVAFPKGWTKNQWARDSAGLRCSPLNQRATCFCVLGAIQRIASRQSDGSLRMTTDRIFDMENTVLVFSTVNSIDSVESWQDDPARTHSEVLVAFDKAIAFMRQRKDTSS
jgi:hypothetical protein